MIAYDNDMIIATTCDMICDMIIARTCDMIWQKLEHDSIYMIIATTW